MLSFLGKTCRCIISVIGNGTETIGSLYRNGSLGMFCFGFSLYASNLHSWRDVEHWGKTSLRRWFWRSNWWKWWKQSSSQESTAAFAARKASMADSSNEIHCSIFTSNGEICRCSFWSKLSVERESTTHIYSRGSIYRVNKTWGEWCNHLIYCLLVYHDGWQNQECSLGCRPKCASSGLSGECPIKKTMTIKAYGTQNANLA